MNYYSTKNKNYKKTFREAIFLGLAEDGGLFMPECFPKFDIDYFKNIKKISIQEVAFQIAKKFIDKEINENDLYLIIQKTLNFNSNLIELKENHYLLELFHGPTLAFKDYGARFMAQLMSYFILQNKNKEINILVATSGDTGSAVASAFNNLEGLKVSILFPKDKVSSMQELQLTTYGNNIRAFEIDGTFDDCQRLVKSAFLDDELKIKYNLTSANSINIARLIPQSFYYFEAAMLINNNKPLIFSVPSGNLGNLTGGIIAQKLGLNISKFISSTNVNSVFTEYINNGMYNPRKSVLTISNAMDVGNPSNYERLLNLFNEIHYNFTNIINSYSFDDNQTKEMIKEIYMKYNYIIDPHGAVACLGAKALKDVVNFNVISLLTAHPAKFYKTIKNILNIEFDVPMQLAELKNKVSQKIKVTSKYDDFKEIFMSI